MLGQGGQCLNPAGGPEELRRVMLFQLLGHQIMVGFCVCLPSLPSWVLLRALPLVQCLTWALRADSPGIEPFLSARWWQR